MEGRRSVQQCCCRLPVHCAPGFIGWTRRASPKSCTPLRSIDVQRRQADLECTDNSTSTSCLSSALPLPRLASKPVFNGVLLGRRYLCAICYSQSNNSEHARKVTLAWDIFTPGSRGISVEISCNRLLQLCSTDATFNSTFAGDKNQKESKALTCTAITHAHVGLKHHFLTNMPAPKIREDRSSDCEPHCMTSGGRTENRSNS